MITRLMGVTAAAEISGASGAAATGGVGGGAATRGGAAGGGAAVVATGAGGAAAATGRGTAGLAGGAEAIAGRCAAGTAGGTAAIGGRATTGPAGGLAAMAGTCGGGAVTIGGAWRGWGMIMRRGAGVSALGVAGVLATGAGAAATGAAAGAGGGAAGLTAAGGAACGRGAGRSASSLRCWIALSTSPGFETRDQSIFCAVFSPLAAAEPPLRLLPRWKCARTRCASSASSELECVLTSVTPTSSSTSRIALLLTSSSLAKSLMRTLLIRPFTWHSACRHSASHSNLWLNGFTCRSI
jgi:hypothetical protein